MNSATALRHILIMSDYWPPEIAPAASRNYDHALEWIKAGHRVTVVTCQPNYPHGRIYDGYRNRLIQREEMDGIEVIRVWTYITRNEGFAKRIIDYVSFLITGFLASFLVRRPDVVLATSPQFFTAISGWLVALVRRIPFVFEVRDIWPESIKAVGAMSDGLVIRFFEWLELFLYRRARAIIVVTKAFRTNLIARGVVPRKVHVVTNGVRLDLWSPTSMDRELAKRHGLEGAFVIGYLGTHGMAHALHRVLEAAECVVESHPQVRFLLLGDGAEKPRLIKQAEEMRLSNVVFVGQQSKQDMKLWWSCCDVALVHLKDADLFATVIPSKIFEAMAMGLPILYAGPDGEAPGVVREHGIGRWVPAESPSDLADAIRAMVEDNGLMEEMKAACLQTAPRFSRSILAHKLLQVLMHVTALSLRCRRE